MNDNQETMVKCNKCGNENAVVRRISKSYGTGATLFVIENVPVVSCPTCRETHLTAETLQTVARIKSNRQTSALSRPVPVAVFA